MWVVITRHSLTHAVSVANIPVLRCEHTLSRDHAQFDDACSIGSKRSICAVSTHYASSHFVARGYLHIVHLLLPGAPLAGLSGDDFQAELKRVAPEFAQESQWKFKQLTAIATRVAPETMAAIHLCQSELQVRCSLVVVCADHMTKLDF